MKFVLFYGKLIVVYSHKWSFYPKMGAISGNCGYDITTIFYHNLYKSIVVDAGKLSHSSGSITLILFGNIPPVGHAHYHNLCDIVT